VAHGVVVLPGLDQGNRKVLVIENVTARLAWLGLASRDQLATNDDAPFGEKDFTTNLECIITSSLNDGWRDVLGANIRFAQVFFCS